MASIGSGGERCDAPCESTKGTITPTLTENSPIVRRSSPRNGTGVRKTRKLGPAMADKAPSASRVTQGTLMP